MNANDNMGQSQKSKISLLIKVQVIIAVLAVAVTIVAVLQIGPLIERKAYLENEIEKKMLDIEMLDKELVKKRVEIEDLNKEIENTQKVLADVVLQKEASDSDVAKQVIDKAIVESTPPGAKIAPRIYMHIREESQRERAKQIAEKLREREYVVPGIQKVGMNKSWSDKTELRYFREREEGEAEDIVEILKTLGLNDTIKQYIPGYENSTKIRDRHYEIWVGPNF